MYGQGTQVIVLLMIYAGVSVMSLIACCYLLFRRNNAIDIDITSPVRLRRWTAAFFAAITLSHFWYLPMFFLPPSSDFSQGYCIAIARLLDNMTITPLTMVVLLTMLQDRRRQLWPVWAAVAPLVVGLAWCVASRSDDLLPVLIGYFLLMWLGMSLYMVRAIRQYGRWLHDNYADIEHKEVWQSFVVLGFFLLVYVVYLLDGGEVIYEYVLEAIIFVLICYLLWRVETLSDLSIPTDDEAEEMATAKQEEDNVFSYSMRKDIGPSLKQHCEEAQLYLQHDVSVTQLAKLIGTNRLYLSQYFSSQGTTYNAYINGLRIRHFINLFRESVTTLKLPHAKQLAYQSGFRNYSTFSTAFKQIMGMTVTKWIRNNWSTCKFYSNPADTKK